MFDVIVGREWIMYGLGPVERVLEQGILRKQFIEAVRVLKLPHYERAEKHCRNLERNREVTLEFLKNLRQIFMSFDRFQPVLISYVLEQRSVRQKHCFNKTLNILNVF